MKTITKLFAGEEEEEEDATPRLVLGSGTPVHELVVKELKTLESLVKEELVGLVTSLLPEVATLVAVRSVVNGVHGAVGVRVRLAVELEIM